MTIGSSRAASRRYPILCTGGLDVIREEAWPSYRTRSGVRLCWELEEPKGPKRIWSQPHNSGSEALLQVMSTWDLSPDSPSRPGHGGWFLPRKAVTPRSLPSQAVNFLPSTTALSYRGTSLIRNHPTVGPYNSPMPRDLR